MLSSSKLIPSLSSHSELSRPLHPFVNTSHLSLAQLSSLNPIACMLSLTSIYSGYFKAVSSAHAQNWSFPSHSPKEKKDVHSVMPTQNVSIKFAIFCFCDCLINLVYHQEPIVYPSTVEFIYFSSSPPSPCFNPPFIFHLGSPKDLLTISWCWLWLSFNLIDKYPQLPE